MRDKVIGKSIVISARQILVTPYYWTKRAIDFLWLLGYYGTNIIGASSSEDQLKIDISTQLTLTSNK